MVDGSEARGSGPHGRKVWSPSPQLSNGIWTMLHRAHMLVIVWHR